jgi:hypothetical protein
MPLWQPATTRGKKVAVQMILPLKLEHTKWNFKPTLLLFKPKPVILCKLFGYDTLFQR